MTVTISNVCNIKKAELEIEENYLNIKYGNNGLGKTSIARALMYSITDVQKLKSLATYGSKEIPKVDFGDKTFNSCLYFNNDYVDKYLFLQKDILNGTYDLIIKTPEYEKTLSDVNDSLKIIKSLCADSNIQKMSEDVNLMASEVKYNADQSDFNYACKFAKGFKDGVTINSVIPDNIKIYEKNIKFGLNFEWFEWLKKGVNYVVDNKCPFCSSELKEDYKERIENVMGFTSSQKMKDNRHSKEMVCLVSKYSENIIGKKIEEINKLETKPQAEDVRNIKLAIDILKAEIEKLEMLKFLDASYLKNMLSGVDLVNYLNSRKLNEDIFKCVDESLFDAVKKINGEITNLMGTVQVLKEKLIEYNKTLSANIIKKKKYVNNFLKIAGIPYEIEVIVDKSTESHTILKPINDETIIEKPKENLSFGEMNAISLILFTVEVMCKEPELIILDDPVSSFDSNKKYAIMHYLFSNKPENISGKSILLLTHDITPIIDFVKLEKYSAINVTADFLKNENGIVSEKKITADDLENSITIEKLLAEDVNCACISRVSHLRRFYEMSKILGDEYNVLSSLLHCYDSPKYRVSRDQYIDIPTDKINIAIAEIQKHISDFDYDKYLINFKNNDYLKTEYSKASNYEKLNIARLYIQNNKISPENEVVWRFICETYHVENQMLFGINDYEYDNIPDYIVSICNSIVK